jgi:hypothetical protein
MDNRVGKWLLIAGLIVLLGALWKKSELPQPQALQPELLDEPVQVEVSKQPIQVRVGEIDYQIKPLYKYDLYGMVVSKHNADTWWDFLHKEWNDKLNITDLCVVWGNNVRSGSYRDISFSSGQFTCNYQTSSSEAWAAFDTTAISNNHLLSADPTVARKLRDVRIGDQVHFSGHLAEYSHNHGFPFKRGTSTVRTDSGNGACETVLVERFDVLRQGGGKWPTVQWIGIALMALGVLAWFSLPVRLN